MQLRQNLQISHQKLPSLLIYYKLAFKQPVMLCLCIMNRREDKTIWCCTLMNLVLRAGATLPTYG